MRSPIFGNRSKIEKLPGGRWVPNSLPGSASFRKQFSWSNHEIELMDRIYRPAGLQWPCSARHSSVAGKQEVLNVLLVSGGCGGLRWGGASRVILVQTMAIFSHSPL